MESIKANDGYKYNDSFSEKEFIDAVLKYIKNDVESPAYIFDEMKCSTVSRINVPLFECDGKSIIEYSRLVGYDTIETTTKYTKTTSGNLNHKTSSRTITKWKNDYGTITGTESSSFYEDKYKIYDDYIANHQMDKNNITKLKDDELNIYPLNNEIIDYLKNDILNKVYENNITYPTNKIKDEKYFGETQLYNSFLTIVSLYSINITIKDKIITFIAITNGEIEIKRYGEYPLDDYSDILNFNHEVTKERIEATKKPRLILKISILSSILLFIILLILGITLNILAMTIISIVILVIGLIIGIKAINDIKKISKPYYKKISEHNNKIFEDKKIIKDEGYLSFIKKNNI